MKLAPGSKLGPYQIGELIGQGGVSVGDERVSAVDRSVTTSDLGTETFLLLRSGKKHYRLVRAR